MIQEVKHRCLMFAFMIDDLQSFYGLACAGSVSKSDSLSRANSCPVCPVPQLFMQASLRIMYFKSCV